MAIIKKTDITPERPVIIVLYGTPGSGKTSVATTAAEPLLIDTDRGFDRAVQRVDTLTAASWNDILAAQNDMAAYKTIIIDTAKACLDDYLADFVVNANYKLRTNTIKRFGEMADQFKAFVNALRRTGTDLIFVCHDKEISEGDVIRHAPDCTGQSKDLLLRIADQVGYISVINRRRTVSFEPTDRIAGKNVAQIPLTQIPDASSPEFRHFMADIIADIKVSLHSKSEAQRATLELLTALREQLQAATSEHDAEELLTHSAALPAVMKKPFFAEMKAALESKGFAYDKAARRFTLPAREDTGAKGKEKETDAKKDGKAAD